MQLCVSGWWNVADIWSLDDVTDMRSVKMHVAYMPLEALYGHLHKCKQVGVIYITFWSALDGVNRLDFKSP